MTPIPLRSFALVAIAASLAAAWDSSALPPDAKDPPVKVIVETVDGSRVIGEPIATELKITTSIGEVDVPFDRVAKVVFNAGDKTAAVSLTNGDHLNGALKLDTFSVQALWGKVELTPAQMRAITVTEHANIWSVKDDFSTTSNPFGAWSYGWVDNSRAKFSLFPSQVKDGWLVGSELPQVWINRGTQVAFGVHPGEVSAHAGSNGQHAVVRWQAPRSCTVHVKGAFGAGDIGAVNVMVLHNADILFKVMDTKKDAPFDLEVAVKTGDTLDFDVAAGSAGFTFGNTPVDAVITAK